jgi:hypothetical protein
MGIGGGGCLNITIRRLLTKRTPQSILPVSFEFGVLEQARNCRRSLALAAFRGLRERLPLGARVRGNGRERWGTDGLGTRLSASMCWSISSIMRSNYAGIGNCFGRPMVACVGPGGPHTLLSHRPGFLAFSPVHPRRVKGPAATDGIRGTAGELF